MTVDLDRERAWVRSQMTPLERRVVAVFDWWERVKSWLRGKMRP